MIGESVGNYVVRSKIGEGGMGAVYLAEHARLGRRVAVKVLLPHMSRNPQLIARFFNEAKAATEIKNQHIVDVLDFGELADGSSYIVMEWLEGKTLSEVLAKEGRLSIARTARIAQGVAKALAAAHAHGIIHRDLKPENIFLVERDGDADFVKVLDFGIAKLALGDAGDVRTQTGAILGTPLYMSPEQCNGAPVDRRTDVYAMGVILYQMLTGTLPFNTTKLTELLVAHATLKPPPLRDHEPSITLATESAVLQALEKDPERRFDSIEALARAITEERHVAALPATTPSALPVPTPVSSPASQTAAEVFVRVGIRGKRPLVIVAAFSAIAVAVLVLLGLSLRNPGPATPPSAATAGASSPEATPPADAKTVTRWKLAKSNCGPGSMPGSVETTQVGNSIVSRAHGFPESKGTADADGSFHVRSRAGSCVGKRIDRTVTETCTNLLHMSCNVSYERID
jgi:serine/threonine-protein kinase